MKSIKEEIFFGKLGISTRGNNDLDIDELDGVQDQVMIEIDDWVWWSIVPKVAGAMWDEIGFVVQVQIEDLIEL